MTNEGARARKTGGQARDTRRRSDGADSRTVRTLAAGMAMLGLFDAEHRNWTLDEMAPKLGVSRMTAYRMARTLQGTGHLVHDPAIGGYRLGPGDARRHLPGRGLRPARRGRAPLPRVAGGQDRRARRDRRGARRRGRLRRPGGLGATLRTGDRGGQGHRRHGQRPRQDVRRGQAGRGAGARRPPAPQEAHGQHHRRPRGPGCRAGEDQDSTAWPGTSKSTTWAPAPWWPPCTTRRARSSPPWGSWYPRAASGPRRGRRVPKAVRSTAARLSEYYGFARPAETAALQAGADETA